MADPKLPPGAKLIQINPSQDFAPKLPPGAKMADLPENFEFGGGYHPGSVADFTGTLLEDAGQFIPGLIRTVGVAAHHPIDTAIATGRSMANLPETISDEWTKEGRPGKAMAHLAELGAPLLTEGAGRLIRLPSGPLAEGALGIRGAQKAFGATPGEAILEETSGIRPSTVEASARNRLIDLNAQLENKARASSTPVSLAGPRSIIDTKIARAAAANSKATPNQLIPMREQLTTARPGFTGATEFPQGAHTPITINQPQSPILGPGGAPVPGSPVVARGNAPIPVVATEQSPIDFLGMKRQFNKDFIRNWNPAANTKGQLGVARQVYGSMANEFNQAVPGAAPINQRISSLIPVKDRARLTDLTAGPGERIIDRVTRPTGGMLPALFGLKEGGVPGLFGAVASQEATASPVVKMLAARGLYGAGKGAQAASKAMIPLTLAQPTVNRR